MKKIAYVGAGLVAIATWAYFNPNLKIQKANQPETLATTLAEEEYKQLLKPVKHEEAGSLNDLPTKEMLAKKAEINAINDKTKAGVYGKEIKQRLSEQGFASDEAREVYKSYSNDTLLDLVKSGNDFIANQIYAERLRDNNQFRDSHQLLLKSAVYGDVKALQQASINSMNLVYDVKAELITEEDAKSILGLENYKGDLQRAIRIKQKAMLLVENIRGFGAEDYVTSSMNKNNEKPFSPGEEFMAKQLAYKLYGDLEAERENLGLGKFDNGRIGPLIEAGLEEKYSDAYKEYLAKK